jgi:CheY-like chemotaxis protein
MRVLLVEDEPYMAEAIRDGLRLEAIAADIAGDGDTALELLDLNTYDIAVLDRDIPGPSGDEIARRIVESGSGMPILMLTAADRLDDKASGFELGADDYLTKPFELKELVLRLRALDRRRAHHRPPVREIAGRAARRPVPPRGLPRRPLRRADPQAVRGARGPRRGRGRRGQRRGAPAARVGRERRPVHQRGADHGLRAAQAARRAVDHRDRRRRRVPDRWLSGSQASAPAGS